VVVGRSAAARPGSPAGEAFPGAALRYIAAYPLDLQAQVRRLIDDATLAEHLRKRYPAVHDVRNDRALYQYVDRLKQEHLRGADRVDKVLFDSKIHLVQQALGLHTARARVQGSRLKGNREIRIASLFRVGPPEFLRMIVVHELAHLRARDHDKAFYQLCVHMEARYHQIEFDVRLYLTHLDLGGERVWGD